MEEKLTLAKVKEATDDFLYVLKEEPSKFLEGEEYVKVKRSPNDKLTHWFKRKSLLFSWK